VARRLARLLLVGIAIVLAHAAAGDAQEDPAAESIRRMVEQIQFAGGLEIGEARIASVTVLPELYANRDFHRAWTDPKAVEDLLAAIRESKEDGLDPDDYHLAPLERLRAEIAAGQQQEPELLADYDVLLTDALVRLAYHLLFGKVDPEALDAHWNLAREIGDRNPAMAMQEAIESGALAAAIDDLKPQDGFYLRLKSALARYDGIRAGGGWPQVPPGPVLKKGMSDERVTAIRRRLAITGDLPGDAADSPVFDDALEEGVKRFQTRHQLGADGTAGAKTVEAMNVPVEQRIGEMRVNLERARWVLHQLEGSFVLVDIAGFELLFVRNEEVVWRTRVQVGKPYRETPVFRSEIKYLVLNPTWTVPPGILNKDVIPAVKRNRGYLAKKNMRIYDSNDRIVDPASIDWSRYPERRFPYRLVQEAGADNALGRIKFIFPNDHAVFLHDTPSRFLFDKTDRTFSSGCIRVEHPFELAALLLNEPHRWSAAQLAAEAATGKTRTIFLPTPLPMLLLYWTVAVDEDGTVNFKPDVYGRDAAILKALDGEFRFRKRPVVPRNEL